MRKIIIFIIGIILLCSLAYGQLATPNHIYEYDTSDGTDTGTGFTQKDLTMVSTTYNNTDFKSGTQSAVQNAVTDYGRALNVNIGESNNVNFAMGVWIKQTDVSAGKHFFGIGNSATHNLQDSVYLLSLAGFYTIGFNFLKNQDTGVPVVANVWKHHIIARTGSGAGANWSYYVNGTLEYSELLDFSIVANSDFICGSLHAVNQGLVGKIDRCTLINRTLTNDDIIQMMADTPSIPQNFTITAINDPYGENLNIFNASINGTLFETTTGTINSEILENSTILWNITISSQNHTTRDYLNYNVSSNLQASLLTTYYKLNISAYAYGGGVINNFSITAINDSDNRSMATITGSLNIQLLRDKTYFILIDPPNYIIANTTILIDDSQEYYNFTDLFFMQTVNITFYNIDTLEVMNGTRVSIQFLGETAQTINTSKGTLNVSLLSPDDYTLLYDSLGFRQGKYILNVRARTFQNLKLYLQNETGTNLILIKTKDRFGNNLQGVQVIIQRWLNDAWITEQIVESDFNGQAEAYYKLSTIYYNHVLKYLGSIQFGAINDDINKKVIYAEDVTNGITFFIDILGDDDLSDYQEVYNVRTNLTYINTSNTTGFFRFFWSHDENTEVEGCLRVRRGNLTLREDIGHICDNCTTTATGILTCSINQSEGTAVYWSVGQIDLIVTDDIIFNLGVNLDNIINWGVTGYIIGFFLVLFAIFMFLSNPTHSILVGSIVFALLIGLGVIFKDIGFGVLITFLVISYLVASIESKSGVNA